MDLLQLQYFRAIATYGSVTKAARALFVTQPNLCTSLSRLEDDLGVKLFDRRKGKITLTKNGELFLEHVNHSLDELDLGIEELRVREHIESTSIRLVSSQSDIIADVLQQCYPQNSEIQIKLKTCANDEVFDLVLNRAVDFGLFYGEPKSRALEYNLIAKSRRILALHRDHPLSQRDEVSLSELSNEKFICDNYRDDRALFELMPGSFDFTPNIYFECDHMQMESALLAMSKGVSILPLVALQKMLRDEPDLPITGVSIADGLPWACQGVVRHRGSRLSSAALHFLSQMTELFQRDEESSVVMLERIRRERTISNVGP